MNLSSFKSTDTYFETTFNDIKLDKETIYNKEFEKCIFNKCNFVEISFNDCKFIDCTFHECLISAMKPINSSWNEIKFYNSKVIGVDWSKAKQIRSLEFYDSQINYSNFRMLKSPHLILKNCEAQEVDFTESDLSESDFLGTDFKKTIFFKTNLTKCNLIKAYNYNIDFKINTLTKTKFSLPEAMSLLNSLDIILEYEK